MKRTYRSDKFNKTFELDILEYNSIVSMKCSGCSYNSICRLLADPDKHGDGFLYDINFSFMDFCCGKIKEGYPQKGTLEKNLPEIFPQKLLEVFTARLDINFFCNNFCIMECKECPLEKYKTDDKKL